jgi:hypothetical protein
MALKPFTGRLGLRAAMKRIKVDVAFITPGRYVAQLDRSWLESPFAVRGFEINGEDHIQLLRKFCKYVYVDSARSSVPEKKIQEAHGSVVKDPFALPVPARSGTQKTSLSQKLARIIRRPNGSAGNGASGAVAGQIAVPLTKEFPAAAAAYKHASKGVNEILTGLRNGKGVSLDKLRGSVEPLVGSIQRNPDSMAWLCYLQIPENDELCVSLTSAVWAVMMGRQLGFDSTGMRNLAMGGIMLDMGNAQIPPSMFSTDGQPTEEEEEILKMHVDYSVKIARTAPGLNPDAMSMIACHHERHDGSGYPNGLAGEDIPVFGRIASLVAYYDEMITHRLYPAQKSSHAAISELNSQAGKKFQKEAVNNIVQAIGMFPTGSLVELNTGEVVIVMEQNPAHRLRPKVMPVLDGDRKPLSSKKPVDLSRVPDSGYSRKARWITKGHVAGALDVDLKQFIFRSRKSR